MSHNNKYRPDPASLGTQIKINNWLPILVMLFSIGMTWGTMRTQYTQQEKEIQVLQGDVAKLATDNQEILINLERINTILKIPSVQVDNVKGVSTSSAFMRGVKLYD